MVRSMFTNTNMLFLDLLANLKFLQISQTFFELGTGNFVENFAVMSSLTSSVPKDIFDCTSAMALTKSLYTRNHVISLFHHKPNPNYNINLKGGHP